MTPPFVKHNCTVITNQFSGVAAKGLPTTLNNALVVAARLFASGRCGICSPLVGLCHRLDNFDRPSRPVRQTIIVAPYSMETFWNSIVAVSRWQVAILTGYV